MTRQPTPAAPRCTPQTATTIGACWYSYAAAGAVAYELQYKSGNATDWTALPPTEHREATVTGLDPDGWYDVRVRYLLDLADPSPWSAPAFCWPMPEPVFGPIPATPVEVYRQWVCRCTACPGCHWYAPCGKDACRPHIGPGVVVATGGGYAGFLDELDVAVLDLQDARDLGAALLTACN